MQHDEFTGQVQDRARLSSRGDAERACRATLETLAERVPEGLAGNLAAQLPHELGEHLRRTEVYGGYGTGVRFGRQDFLDRVASRAGVSSSQAAFLVRAVTEVTDHATRGALMPKVRQSLPADNAGAGRADCPLLMAALRASPGMCGPSRALAEAGCC